MLPSPPNAEVSAVGRHDAREAAAIIEGGAHELGFAAKLGNGRFRALQHLLGAVDADHFARRADHLGREEAVMAGSAAKIDHHLALAWRLPVGEHQRAAAAACSRKYLVKERRIEARLSHERC